SAPSGSSTPGGSTIMPFLMTPLKLMMERYSQTDSKARVPHSAHDFGDAVRVNHGPIGFAEEHDDVEILWRAEIPRAFEGVFRAIVQSHRERTERLPLGHFLDVSNFHDVDATPLTMRGNQNS